MKAVNHHADSTLLRLSAIAWLSLIVIIGIVWISAVLGARATARPGTPDTKPHADGSAIVSP